MDSIIQTLAALDTDIFLAINGHSADFWDTFMVLFTGKFIWVPMYATIFYLLYRTYNWRVATTWVVAIVLTITVCDQVCATVIRPVVERLRPAHPDNPISPLVYIVNGYRGGHYGFPSCHSANSFGLAMILAMLFRGRRFIIFLFVWAIVNSFSRLYMGVHYPGDLLVGALIGMAAGALIYWLAMQLMERCFKLDVTKRYQSITISGIGKRPVRMRVTDVMVLAGVLTVVYIAVAAM